MYEFFSKSRQLLICVFSITSFVFLYYSVHFLFGNHDWHYLISPIPMNEFFYIGRWFFGFLANYADGHVLPIINSSFAFLILSTASVLYVKYIDLDMDFFSSTLVCLTITLLPSVLGVLYFQYMIVPYFSAILCAICGLIISRKFSVQSFIFAAVLICFSLAMYGNVINSIAVVFISGVIAKVIKSDNISRSINYIFMSTVREFSIIVFGGLLYVISVKIIKKWGGAPDTHPYATSMISIFDFFQNFIKQVPNTILQPLYSQPFFPKYLQLSLGIFVLFSFMLLVFSIIRVHSSKIEKVCFMVVFFSILILSTRTVFFINTMIDWAQNHFRISYFGMSFFYAFCASIAIYLTQGKVKVCVKVLLCIFLFIFAIQDANAQKLWKFANDQEQLFQNRLLNRIETTKEFDINKQYTYLSLGSYPSFGKALIDKSYKVEKYSNEFIEWPSPLWGMAQGLCFINPQLKIKNAPNIHLDYLNEFSMYADFFKDNKAILDVARPWPHTNSVFVIGDVILVVMDKHYLDKARKLALQ